MTCNYLNEGCAGGWPLFNGDFAESAYFVTEECAPYQADTIELCSSYAHCKPHSKVQKSYFIGRGYGDTSEKKMMKEIIHSGSISGEL